MAIIPLPTVPFIDPITREPHAQWIEFFRSIENAVPTNLPPVDAHYVTTTNDATLTNETNLATLGSGLLKQVVGAGIATLSTLPFPGGTDDFLRADGAFAPPFAGSIDLTTDVTGDLPYANLEPATAASRVLVRGSAGGAGDWEEGTLGAGLTLTGTVLSATGGGGGGSGDVVGPASAVDDQIATFDGVTGKLIQDGGKTIATVVAEAVTAATAAIVPVSLASGVSGDLPYANLTQGAALSVLGVTGNATADVASIAAGTDHYVLRRSGTALAFGPVNLSASNAITGDLPLSNLATSAAASRLLGRGSAGGAGDWQPLTLGAPLSMAGTVLNSPVLYNGASAVVANAADTYLTGSALAIGARIKAGTVLSWRLVLSKTAAGTAAPTVTVRFGTAGTISDTARITVTGPAQTAATDDGWYDLTVLIDSVGASATVTAGVLFTHTNTTTGLSTTAQPTVQTATSATFDNTSASLMAGVSVHPGASAVWTFHVVAAQATNLT